MAIMDAQLLFSDAQAITSAAASTSYVDLGAAQNVAVGRPLYVLVTLDVAMTDASSDSELDVILYYDSTTTFTPDAQVRLLRIPAASAAGSKFVAPLPNFSGSSTEYRYIKLYYDPQDGNLSTGTVTAGIVLDPPQDAVYADNITIS